MSNVQKAGIFFMVVSLFIFWPLLFIGLAMLLFGGKTA